MGGAVRDLPGDRVEDDVPRLGQEDDETGEALASELISYCREHLADVKCPRSVDFRDELPRHPTGKLYKRLLKDEYWADAGRTI